ncbi:zinc ribbon domain-containing protein [Tepidibacillus marianensis]|uniref:zinc ribbon domain-containing protein n=1 Tax=Tepidibacillus marianensis TaxID=3131995 RepID=UPI0030D55477
MARTEVDYLLTTKLFCGRCGGNMIGESGTSRHGTVYHYYKCNNNKRRRICDKKAVRKKWIEELVVRETVQQVLQDDVIAKIADAVMALQEREQVSTVLYSMEQQLKETEKAIKNMMTAIEQGIITSSTKERLMELEAQRDDLIVGISKEQIRKPRIERDQVIFWLEKFRGGDYTDEDYQRTVIDAFVNAVYLYDDEIRIAYNYTGPQSTVTRSIVENCDKSGAPECSALASFAPPNNIMYKPFIYKGFFFFTLLVRLN